MDNQSYENPSMNEQNQGGIQPFPPQGQNQGESQPFPPQQPSSTSQVDQSTAIIVGVLCIIIPFLGVIGVHDFVVGRKKEGKDHIKLGLAGILAVFFMMSVMGCDGGCSDIVGTILSILAILGMAMSILPLASYIWAIVECIGIFTGKYR